MVPACWYTKIMNIRVVSLLHFDSFILKLIYAIYEWLCTASSISPLIIATTSAECDLNIFLFPLQVFL